MTKRISDEAVKKRTKKMWDEWFSILNKAGAKKMGHKAIAQLLNTKYGLSEWWSQMVTVQYEQDMKGRKKHETKSGFQVSRTITLPYSATKIFNALNSPLNRIVWLADPGITITKSTGNKSIRAKWVDKKTLIEFQLYVKDINKTQLVIQHNKLSSAKEAERMKKYWLKSLNKLEEYLSKRLL
jgi:hypothetical protein